MMRILDITTLDALNCSLKLINLKYVQFPSNDLNAILRDNKSLKISMY